MKLQNLLDKNRLEHNVTFNYKIANFGPSAINQLEILVQIPTIYIPEKKKAIQLVDFDKIEVQASNGNKIFNVEIKTKEEDVGELKILDPTQQLFQNGTINSNEILRNLPKDRTIFLDCTSENENVRCSDLSLTIQNFEAAKDPIKINVNFSINFSQIGKFLKDSQDSLINFSYLEKNFNFIVLKSAVKLLRNEDETIGNITILRSTHPFAIFYKTDEVNILIYIFSILIGILILSLTIFSLFKLGFFERIKKEELDRLTKSMYSDEHDYEELELKN